MEEINSIDFFTESDFRILREYAGFSMEPQNTSHRANYEYLAHTYDKVKYWAEQVQKHAFPGGYTHIIRKPTNQANYFSEYLWAKIYPTKTASKQLAFTIEINADSYFIIKIDTVGLNDSNELRHLYHTYRSATPKIIKTIPYSEIIDLGWENLIQITIDFIKNTFSEFTELTNILRLDPGQETSKTSDPPETYIVNTKTDDINYWLFIFSAQSWPNVFEENETLFLHNRLSNGTPRNVPENFKEVKKGDILFGIHRDRNRENNSFFKITKELHYTEKYFGECIEFELVHQTDRSLTLSDLMEELRLYQPEANRYEYINGLYKLSPVEIGKILSVLNTNKAQLIKSMYQGTMIPIVQSDTAFDSIEDQLDFKADIETIAALTAYKKIAPPLAIGLFGNWGTGKSYFMHHLAKKIQTYQDSKNTAFCQKIVKVNFNTWHYSDTNLWASMANQIFSTLKKYVNDEGGTAQHQGESAKLFRELNSTKAKIQEKENEVNRISNEISAISLRLEEIRTEKQGKVNSLRISMDRIIGSIMEDPGIAEQIKRIQKLTVGPNIENIEILQSQLSLLQNLSYRLTQAFRNISQYKCREWVFYIVIPLLIISAPWAISAFFKEQLGNWHLFLSSFTNKCIAITTGFFIFLRPINKVLAYHESLQASMMRLKKEKLAEKADNEIEIENILEEYKIKENIVSKQLENLNITKSRLESEIADIKSGKKLAEWITDRASSQDYKKHLGIISLIREDFERLNELMDDQKRATNTYVTPEEEIFKIDRIVLFIDDLDRCPQDNIMEVLQAVHLLLSFKLFVVIVGVDPRWLENAIEYKYRVEMGYDGPETSSGTPLKAKDYLEKIFQIPFKLKGMSTNSSKKLISSLLKETLTPNPYGENEEEAYEEPSNATIVGNEVNPLNIPLAGATETHVAVPEKKPLTPPSIDSKELELGKDEQDFMLSLSPILINSPRNIKRYVNIYRLIKAHPDYRALNPLKIHNEILMSMLCLEINGSLAGTNWLNNLLHENNKTRKFSDIENYPINDGKNYPETIKQVFDSNTVADFVQVIEFVKRFSYED